MLALQFQTAKLPLVFGLVLVVTSGQAPDFAEDSGRRFFPISLRSRVAPATPMPAVTSAAFLMKVLLFADSNVDSGDSLEKSLIVWARGNTTIN